MKRKSASGVEQKPANQTKNEIKNKKNQTNTRTKRAKQKYKTKIVNKVATAGYSSRI